MVNLTPRKTQSGGRSRVKVLLIPLALTVTLLGGIGWYIWDSSQTAKKTKIRDNRILELSGDIKYWDEALTMSARMAAATGDLRWEQRYRSFEPKVDAAVKEGTQLLPKIFRSEGMIKADAAAVKLFDAENRAFKLIQQGKRPAAAALLASPEYKQQQQIYSQALQQTLAAMKNYVQASLQAEARQATVAVIVVVLALLMLVVAWASVLRTLLRYIQAINQAGASLSSTSSEMAATVEQQERTAAQQAAAVSQVTATMDELGASSRQAAEQAESAAASSYQMLNLAESSASGARQVLNLAEGGTKSVEQTLDGMSTLKEKVLAIADQIMHLSEQTNQIGNITRLVTDIANQTNMLSLNAAVEAARAGENGKGFAVVASEIRKLADQSKKSAEKIHTLISDIQNAINLTVMVTDEGKKNAEAGIKLSQETASAFSSMAQAINDVVLKNQEISLTSINDVAAISQQISLTAKQQAVAIQQVVEAMNNINQGATQTASGLVQTKIGSQKLNETALELKALV